MIEQDVSARVHPGIIALQRDVLRSGHPLRIILHGMSMFPFIRPGETAQVRPVGWTALRRGDIVFYERDSRLVAHRVMTPPFDAESPLIAKGDTLGNFDPPVLPNQLMGRVEAVERDGRVVSLVDGRGRALQLLAAELSGPWSALFWKGAALRRRTLRLLLHAPPYRRHRRAHPPRDISTRDVTPDDADTLANCLWDLQPQRDFAQMRAWVARRIEDATGDGAVLRALDDGRRLLGIGALRFTGNGEAWLTDLYLHPLARGFGWGERLLAALEEALPEAADGRRELSARIPANASAARRLLAKHGWRAGSGAPSSALEALFPSSRPDEAAEARVFTRSLTPHASPEGDRRAEPMAEANPTAGAVPTGPTEGRPIAPSPHTTGARCDAPPRESAS